MIAERKELHTSDIKRLMIRSYRRYSNGEISEAQAYKENVMLANILKAIESSEIENRLQALENSFALMDGEDNGCDYTIDED